MPTQTSGRGSYEEYAAIGDSYSASGGIPVTDLVSGCYRSDHNYSNLLARELKVRTFRDATCGGADTADVLRSTTTVLGTRARAQLDAVTGTTDLVTVSIGANDYSLIQAWITGRFDQPATVVPMIGNRVSDVLDAVHKKAPDAQVVLLGYPRLVDPGTACPQQTPFSQAQHDTLFKLGEQLDDELRRAAVSTDSIFVDLFAASKDHGICSTTPWVNGQHTILDQAVAYHPFASEQEAAAMLIARAVLKSR